MMMMRMRISSLRESQSSDSRSRGKMVFAKLFNPYDDRVVNLQNLHRPFSNEELVPLFGNAVYTMAMPPFLCELLGEPLGTVLICSDGGTRKDCPATGIDFEVDQSLPANRVFSRLVGTEFRGFVMLCSPEMFPPALE
jgi:hypothetical protein